MYYLTLQAKLFVLILLYSEPCKLSLKLFLLSNYISRSCIKLVCYCLLITLTVRVTRKVF